MIILVMMIHDPFVVIKHDHVCYDDIHDISFMMMHRYVGYD